MRPPRAVTLSHQLGHAHHALAACCNDLATSSPAAFPAAGRQDEGVLLLALQGWIFRAAELTERPTHGTSVESSSLSPVPYYYSAIPFTAA